MNLACSTSWHLISGLYRDKGMGTFQMPYGGWQGGGYRGLYTIAPLWLSHPPPPPFGVSWPRPTNNASLWNLLNRGMVRSARKMRPEELTVIIASASLDRLQGLWSRPPIPLDCIHVTSLVYRAADLYDLNQAMALDLLDKTAPWLCEHVQELRPRAIANIVYSWAKCSHIPLGGQAVEVLRKHFLLKYEDDSEWCSDLRPQDLNFILWALKRFTYQGFNDQEWTAVLCKHAEKEVELFHPVEIASTLMAVSNILVKAGDEHMGFVEKAAQTMLAKASRFEPAMLADSIWSLAKLGWYDIKGAEALLQQVLVTFPRGEGQAPPSETVATDQPSTTEGASQGEDTEGGGRLPPEHRSRAEKIAVSSGGSGHSWDSKSNADLHWCYNLMGTDRKEEWTPYYVSSVVWAMGRWRHYNEALLRTFCEFLLKAPLDDTPMSSLVRFLWGLAVLDVPHHEVFAKLTKAAQTKLSYFNDQELCDVAMSCAIVDYFDPDFISAVWGEVRQRQIKGYYLGNRLMQCAHWLRSIGHENLPASDVEYLNSLSCSCQGMEQPPLLHTILIPVVEELGWKPVEGYIVEDAQLLHYILLNVKDQGPVAMLAAGHFQYTTTRPGRPLGSMVFKYNMLQKTGLPILFVPFFELPRVVAPSHAAKKYLRQKMDELRHLHKCQHLRGN